MSNSDTGSVGNWAAYIRELLDVRGERPADFARAASVNNSLVSRWLTSSATPDVPTLRKISAATGVPLLELLVRAGHITEMEAQIDAPPKTIPKPRQVTIEEAIRDDSTIPEHHREVLRAVIQVIRGQIGQDPWRRPGHALGGLSRA